METKILQVIAEDLVQAGLVVHQRYEPRTDPNNAHPADAHKDNGEQGDRQQRRHVVEPIKHSCPLECAVEAMKERLNRRLNASLK